MRWQGALFGLMVGTTTASCSFLLDFDALQKEEGAAATGGTGGLGGTGGDGSTDVPLDQLGARFAQALCKRLDRCYGLLATAALGDESCVPYFEKFLGESVFAGLAQLSPQRFSYHPDKAPACLADVENADCDLFFPKPESCDQAIEGLVAGAGECTHAAECVRGFYCDAQPTACPGKCQPKPKSGQPCAGGVCAEGLQCEELATKPTCLPPVSKAFAACEGGTNAHCRIDMTCLGKDEGKPGQCRAIKEVFTATAKLPCNWQKGSLCGVGLHCALSTPQGLDGTCEATAGSLLPCKLALPDMCPLHEYCNITSGVSGQCEKLPEVKQNCAVYPLKALCQNGNRCVDRDEVNPLVQPGHCEGIATLGQSCTQDELCYSGYCDTNSKCATPNYCTL